MMRFAVAFFLFCSVAFPQNAGRVEGRLVDADTGEGIRKGWLTLRASGSSANGYTTLSDSHGGFAFESVDPGHYTLGAEQASYLRASTGQVNVGPREVVKAVRIGMTAQGVISGRVFDEDGDPLPGGIQVQVARWRWDQQTGQRTLTQIKQTSADDQGSFRLSGLPAGNYYLSAYGGRTTAAFDDRSVMPGSQAYSITYYPGVPGPSGATTIAVKAGNEIRDMTLRLRKTRVARIRGIARDISTGNLANQIALRLIPLGAYPVSPLTNDAVSVVQNGSFEFPRVASGTYAIMAPDNAGATHLVGRYDVTVTDGEINGIQVPLGPGAAVEAHFKMESNDPAPAGMLFALRSADGTGVDIVAKGDGNDAPVRATGIPPGRYWMDLRGNARPPNPNAYVKSIHLGNIDATNQPIDILSTAQPPLEFVISPNGGSLTGTVRNEKGEPVPAAVILAPASAELGMVSRLVKLSPGEPQGTFRFTAIAPGDYLLFALDGGDMGAMRDPAVRAALTDKAVKVTVQEGSMLTTDVPVIPEAAVTAALEKLP